MKADRPQKNKGAIGDILYVEDDEDTRDLVTCVLAMKNYEVVAAENCDDALMLARSTQFRFISDRQLDVRMFRN